MYLNCYSLQFICYNPKYILQTYLIFILFFYFRYIFDRVFNANEDNSKVYQDLGFDIIEAAVSGFNSTIFAYGQTASGKTHTMMGDDQQKGKHFLMNFVTDFTLF